MMSIISNRICEGYRKEFELVVALEEVQLMLPSRLDVATIVDVNGEHFAIEITKPRVYLG